MYQNQVGVDCVIGYGSRSFSKTMHKYPAQKLEFLALKWAIMKLFQVYLYDNTFVIYTDNNPLTYVLTNVKLDAIGHHWVASYANYIFPLSY